MKEVIAELLNEGNVILYNKDMLNEVIKELEDKNIQYNIKHYEEYVYITKTKGVFLMKYYAVKCFDGSYLAQGCKEFTFDRNEMQLFHDEKTAEDMAIKSGYPVDNEQIFVVVIDETSLIDYITENSVVY